MSLLSYQWQPIIKKLLSDSVSLFHLYHPHVSLVWPVFSIFVPDTILLLHLIISWTTGVTSNPIIKKLLSAANNLIWLRVPVRLLCHPHHQQFNNWWLRQVTSSGNPIIKKLLSAAFWETKQWTVKSVATIGGNRSLLLLTSWHNTVPYCKVM